MSKKMKYLVMDGDNIEYVIKVKENKKGTHIKMFYSKGEQWSPVIRDGLCEYWLDTGNGIEGLDVDDKGEDYDRIDRLKIMLDFLDMYDKNLYGSYKFLKV